MLVNLTTETDSTVLNMMVTDLYFVSNLFESLIFCDAQEAATVLSAVSVALSNVNTVLPVFIPVHDKYRDGMQGIAILNGRTVHFETDSSQTSQRPDYLRCVQGQLHILSHKLEPYSIDAAKLCSILSEGEEIGDSHKRNSVHTSFHVAVSSCVAYQVPVPVLKWSRTASAIGAEMEVRLEWVTV